MGVRGERISASRVFAELFSPTNGRMMRWCYKCARQAKSGVVMKTLALNKSQIQSSNNNK